MDAQAPPTLSSQNSQPEYRVIPRKPRDCHRSFNRPNRHYFENHLAFCQQKEI
jgi:hypothetical protein